MPAEAGRPDAADCQGWLDAEADATELAARADEAADEFIDYPDSYPLWPRSAGPIDTPAA